MASLFDRLKQIGSAARAQVSMRDHGQTFDTVMHPRLGTEIPGYWAGSQGADQEFMPNQYNGVERSAFVPQLQPRISVPRAIDGVPQLQGSYNGRPYEDGAVSTLSNNPQQIPTWQLQVGRPSDNMQYGDAQPLQGGGTSLFELLRKHSGARLFN